MWIQSKLSHYNWFAPVLGLRDLYKDRSQYVLSGASGEINPAKEKIQKQKRNGQWSMKKKNKEDKEIFTEGHSETEVKAVEENRQAGRRGTNHPFIFLIFCCLHFFSRSTANILTVIILSQLVLRRQKSSYNYLLALAIADILVLLLIVFVDFLLEDFILGAPLPHSLNKAVQVLEFSSIHTSIWITVPLTVDRYIAVCHPLRYHTVSYPARTRKVILAVYAGCLITSVPYYWWPELWHGLPGASAGGRSSSAGQHVLVWVHCATVYLLPCSVFFSLNAIIVRKLRCRRSCFRLRGYSTGKTTAILLAITSVFAVLWAPRTLMILYHLYTAQPAMPGPARLLHLVTDVANMLALLNTGVNFFLYCFISKRFRRMAGTVLKALFRCRKQPPPFYASHNFSITSSPWISPANSHCIKMLVYQYDKNGKPVCISS
ncbi:putative G-protein coupled receptor 139 [Labeo rohita]|uniref:G-protein coupled receptor 139 n=1 Tax=Labeo rohita TaxID=84645 RepID=A0ABQ8LDS5_LABRO|nr:putative G-protein coupled receptor 139 [Labeo rohita]